MSANREESLSEKVLKFLGEKSMDFLNLGLIIMFDPDKLIREYGITLYKSPSYIPKAVQKLKKSPYFAKKGSKFYVTEKGRIKIIKNILKRKNQVDKELSGLWLGIIFDIPEANRRERAFLRRELTMAGCKELQKSVWVTPFDIEKELLALLALWKKDFMGDIRFLKIKEISGEADFKKRFKL